MALHMVGWRYLIEPQKPKEVTKGGIVLVDSTKEAEQHLKYIGQILAVGEAAMMTKTTGGIDMSKFKVRPEVGKWVIYSPYGGFQVRRKPQFDGDTGILLVVKDTEIHGVFDSYEDTLDYYAWLDA